MPSLTRPLVCSTIECPLLGVRERRLGVRVARSGSLLRYVLVAWLEVLIDDEAPRLGMCL